MAINSAAREHNLSYSKMIWALNRSNLECNRLILADMAVNEPYTFKAILDELKLQTGVEPLQREEFSIYDALGQGHLVYGEVKEEEEGPKFSSYTTGYITHAYGVPKEEQKEIVFIDKE